MDAYRSNGAQLGWLLLPEEQAVEIWPAAGEPQRLEGAVHLVGWCCVPKAARRFHQLCFSSWSYWAWVPIHTQINSPSIASTAKARCLRPTRTDQNRPIHFRCSEGWRGSALSCSYARSASR